MLNHFIMLYAQCEKKKKKKKNESNNIEAIKDFIGDYQGRLQVFKVF